MPASTRSLLTEIHRESEFCFHKLVIFSVISSGTMIQMSTSPELEQLKNKRAGLEDESRSLKQRQESLEERTRVLEEKIAIEELKNNNKTASESVAQLEARLNELENRLKQVSQTPATPEPPQETVPETNSPLEPPQEVEQETKEAAEPAEEENVTISAFDDTVATEPVPREEKSGSEKKKRKFL